MNKTNETMQGEGNREADRNYREQATAFARSEDREQAEKELRRDMDKYADELAAAEREAQQHAKDRIDASNEKMKSRIVKLRELRDDLRVRAHLMKKDLEEKYETLEEKFRNITKNFV